MGNLEHCQMLNQVGAGRLTDWSRYPCTYVPEEPILNDDFGIAQ